jgi:RNA polymerase sigma-70 factor (ECF subfamily)
VTTNTGRPLEWTIARAQAGDAVALEAVLREAERTATPMLRRVVGEGAHDVLQGVLWDVARKLRWLEDPSAFRAWIYRIAVRAALKHLKREKRVWPFEPAGRDVDLELVAAPPPDDSRRGEIEQLLGTLSPRSRVVIVLHYLEEMPLDRVAAVLDVPLGTVKSRLAYGLAALRREAREKNEKENTV